MPLARSVMPARSQRPFGSACATLTIAAPDAIFGKSSFCVSASAHVSSVCAANTDVPRNGAQSSARPISSIAIKSSTGPKPAPPCSSGMTRPTRPSSSASCFQTSGS